MALAYLKYDGSRGGHHHFQYDIGSSRHFIVGIGEGRQRSRRTGLEHLEEVYHQTPQAMVKPSALGRGTLALPAHLFKPRQQYVQLISFRRPDKSGAAYSKVISLFHTNTADDGAPFELPPLGFSNQHEMRNQTTDRIPFQFSEHTYSDSMFLASIIGGISSILPKVLPIITQLLPAITGALQGGKKSNGKPSTPDLGGVLGQLLSNPQVMAALKQAMAPAAKTKSLPAVSEAQAFPIAALLPMLKGVMKPETIKAALDSPNKLLKTITDSLLNMNQQELKHLEALNPGVDADNQMIENILASMSLAVASNASAIKYKRIKSVKLSVPSLSKVEVVGREIAVYSKAHDMVIPVQLETPKPIAKAVVQLQFKDASTLQLLGERRIRQEHLANGATLQGIVIPREDLQELPTNRDISCCISLIFKNTRKQNIGAYHSHLFQLTEAYHAGKIIASTSPAIPLNDIVAHRNFWHKVWEDDFKGNTRTLEFQIKYYNRLREQGERNAQVETKILYSDPKGMGHQRTLKAKLKSGFEVSIQSLNELIPQISNHQPLSPTQLQALNSEDFVDHFDTLASAALTFRGRPGDMSALWVFPELEMKKILLKRPTSVDANGQVIAFEDEAVHFPVPRSVHFVGVRSER